MKHHGKRILSILLALSMLTALSITFGASAEGGYVLPDTYNFSEHNMVSNLCSLAPDTYTSSPDYGGYFEIALAYLASSDGAVLDTEDQYPEDAWEDGIEFGGAFKGSFGKGAVSVRRLRIRVRSTPEGLSIPIKNLFNPPSRFACHLL